MRITRCTLSHLVFGTGLMLGLATGSAQEAPRITVEATSDTATVRINGTLFTRYLANSDNRPILWPIMGPNGKPVTRAYPMRDDATGETSDHPHHRSLWFGHGDANGVDFWSEANGSGTIRHADFLQVQSVPEPLIVTRNEWIAEDGTKICTDYRELRFGADEDRRWIDFDVTIVNDTDRPLVFGDTKEGTFGIRVADSIRVDGKMGGRIVNSLGARDAQAWGQAASWVDYSGPLGEDWIGIAVLNHPSSFRFPTFWHVRTYGLLGANVFGVHNFKNSHEEDGSHTLQPHEQIPFYYRVILHRGDEQQGRIPEAFAEYVKVDKAIDGIQPPSIGKVPLVAPEENETSATPTAPGT
jgi:hypothetical protein